MKPADFLKMTETMVAKMEQMKVTSVNVGLPQEKVGGKIYGDGMTIIRVGAIHEFGAGRNPQRSFLRVPYIVNKKAMNNEIKKQFESVTIKGASVQVGLDRIGAVATNISKKAFTTKGHGQWQDIKPATKKAKGSSQVLIDTGILRNSLTWALRNDS